MKKIQSIALIATLALSTNSYAEDAYPSRTIKIIVPIAAGGVNDVQARAFAAELQRKIGQPVVVDNRPGGNFVIGSTAVSAAPPDGYTLGWAISAQLSLNPLVYKSLPYKSEKFELLAPVSKGHQLIVVSKNVKANTLQEWIEEIKKSGLPAPIGVSSYGGTTHLMAEDLAERGGFTIQPIVYKGEAPAGADLVAGQLPALSGVVPTVLEYYRANKVKILAISSEKRLAELPNVPTFKELGYPIVTAFWNGLFAPHGTPKAIVDKLSTLSREVVASPEFKERLSSMPDLNLIPGGPDAIRDLIKNDQEYYGRVIKKHNITIDN
jgi:tripartite-type tricarboxylate transporter receptor subunit TctC